MLAQKHVQAAHAADSDLAARMFDKIQNDIRDDRWIVAKARSLRP